jgi:hypothetical protein
MAQRKLTKKTTTWQWFLITLSIISIIMEISCNRVPKPYKDAIELMKLERYEEAVALLKEVQSENKLWYDSSQLKKNTAFRNLIRLNDWKRTLIFSEKEINDSVFKNQMNKEIIEYFREQCQAGKADTLVNNFVDIEFKIDSLFGTATTTEIAKNIFEFLQIASDSSYTGMKKSIQKEWYSNIFAFVNEVVTIRKKTRIPPEEPWTIGANNGNLTRLGTILFKDEIKVAVITHKYGGIEGEFGFELTKRFSPRTIYWKAIVKEDTIDVKTQEHIIKISFPKLPVNCDFDIQPLELKIPFSKFPRSLSLKPGSIFSFTGDLKVDKESWWLQEPVEAIYWFRSADFKPTENRIWVVVSITNVSPVK